MYELGYVLKVLLHQPDIDSSLVGSDFKDVVNMAINKVCDQARSDGSGLGSVEDVIQEIDMVYQDKLLQQVGLQAGAPNFSISQPILVSI